MDGERFIKEYYSDYLVKRDLNKTLNYYSDNITMIGTDSFEKVTNKSQAKAMLSIEMRIDPEPYQIEFIYVNVDKASEEFLYILSEMELTKELNEGNTCFARIRTSAFVIREEDGEYRISSIHSSVSNDIHGNITGRVFCLGKGDMNRLTAEGNEKALQILKDSINGGMYGTYLEEDFPLYYVDQKLLNYLGFTYNEFVNKTDGLAINMLYQEDRKRVVECVDNQLKTSDKYEIKYRLLKKDGTYIWVEERGCRILSRDNKPALTCIIVDLTPQLETEEERLEARKSLEIAGRQSRFLQSLYYTIPCGLVQYIPKEGMKILYANDAMFDLIGYSREEFEQKFNNKILKIVLNEDYNDIVKIIENVKINETCKSEHRIVTKSNGIKWIHSEATALINEDDLEVIQAVYTDITELKEKEREKEERIRTIKERDLLTGFYSKSYGQFLIKKYLSGRSEDEMAALLVVDVDNFAVINDAYGVAFGDVIIKEIAEKIQSLVKKEDILVRIGGDEFLVFITDTTIEDSDCIAENICQGVKTIYAGENSNIIPSCTIGIIRTLISDKYEVLYRYGIGTLEYTKKFNKGGHCNYMNAIAYKGDKVREEYINSHLVNDILESYGEDDENMVSFAFRILEKSKDLPSAINILLSRIGKKYNLDRVSVVEIDTEYLTAKFTYQWSNNPDFIKVNKEYYLNRETYMKLEKAYDSDGISSITIAGNREALKSVLHAAIFEKGVYRGVICFEKEVDYYEWEFDIRRVLKEISKIISTYILKVNADSVSKAKTEFLSRMSHEIRTPMNAITGMVSIAKNFVDDKEKVSDCLNKIESSTKYLISLVNDVLDMSKIESGKLTISNDSFDLNNMLMEIETLMRPQTDSKNIELIIEHKYRDRIVTGDELRLSQVLVNIIGNAVKFTDENGKILVSVEQLLQEDDFVVIKFCVKDNGAGISKENIERIFNAFEQEDENTARRYGGTGLGLPISSNLVKLMGGSLKVNSKVNEGSEFYFTLNLKKADKTNKKVNLKSEDIIQGSLKNKRVLLVEDNELNIEIAKTLLEMAGCIVEVARNGEEAVKAFWEKEAFYYDVILMDIRMPVMDGLEATKRIRTLNKKDSRSIPIIATTANAFDEDTKKSIASGMNGHLAKPLEIGRLYETLEQL